MGMSFKKTVTMTAAAIITAAVFISKNREPDITRRDSPRIMNKSASPDQDGANFDTPSQTPPLSAEAATQTPQATHNPKVALLREILASRNDNDPRLDTELRVLDEQTKSELRQEYLYMEKEKLNQRGTIVFLLGRNLASPADFDFFESVIDEPACRSLEKCTRDEVRPADAEHLHHEAGTEITLAYPQVVAIKAAETFLRNQTSSHPLHSQARELVEKAKKSPIEPVRGIAEGIRF